MKEVAAKIYSFMDTVEKLCYVRRDMFRSDGTKESDSDHIMKLCFLLMMALPYIKQPIDSTKVLEMALVHDLVEADVGDVPRLLSDHSKEIKEQKKILEYQAIERYKNELPEPIAEKIYNLFIEYEERKTPEAKLVKIFDKYEGDMQTLKESSELLKRKLKNGRHEFVLNYLREDVAAAESDGELLIAELQKLQLNIARENIDKLKEEGLL
jgi:putative hydrolase of HD superfamily